MNPLIIASVACPLCEAPKGSPCTRENGCGMRIDHFRVHGPLATRLEVHHQTQTYLKTISLEMFQEMEDEPLFVTREELDHARRE